MDVADNAEFRHRLMLLAEVFDLKLAATRQALYFEALRDVPFEGVIQAMNQAVKTCTFFPKPAELRAFALGDDEDRAEAAWLLCRQAMRQAGAYASLAVQDPALAETILAVFGSWPQACQTDLSPEMWASTRKTWGRVYRVITGRQLVGARYLAGVCEQQNAGRLDWQRYVPVHLVAGETVRKLGPAEAEAQRQLMAAQASGFTQIAAGIDLPRVLMDDTA